MINPFGMAIDILVGRNNKAKNNMYEALITIVMILVGLVSNVKAQENKRVWSMDECINYAIDCNVDVMNAELDYKDSQSTMVQAAAAFAPYVESSVDGNVRWGRNVDQNTNTYMQVTQFSNDYKVTASMDLFNGGKTINEWRQARLAKDKTLNEYEKKKDDIAIEIMKAYTNAVYYKGSVSLKEKKFKTSEELLRQAKLQYEIGIKNRNDLALIQSTHSADESALLSEKKNYENSIMRLKMYMSMPVREVLDVDTLLTETQVAFGTDDIEDVFRYAEENNLTAKSIRLEKKLYNLSYKTSILSALPTISVFAQIGTGYYRDLSGDSGAAFRDQFEANRGEIVGMTVSLPLFDRLGRATSIKRSKISYQKVMNIEKKVMQQLEQDIQLAIMDRDAYVVEVASMERNVESTEIAYQLASKKFEEGLLSALEIRSAAEDYFYAQLMLLSRRLTLLSQQRLVDYYKGIKSW